MNWSVFLSTLGLILVAELGDKTQLAVIAQTCKYRRPGAVFLGATAALSAVTGLGVAGGHLLGQWLPAGWLQAAAALAFVVMGLLVAREAFRAGNAAAECAASEDVACAPPPAQNWKAFASTLVLLFVAELGDKTQLAVLSLAGRYRAPWSVFVGGALALTLVTALGVVGGQALTRVIPPHLLLWASAVAFVVMGVLMGVGVL